MPLDTSAVTESVEITPGTIHLVDPDGTLKSKHATGADQDIVLVPTPSSHPDDPLNWSHRRKMLAAGCMALYVVVTGICSSALYSTLDPLSKATGLTYLDLNSGTGYMFLLFGWGCVFWQSVATQYGMRPVYLISAAGTMNQCVMIWQAHIKSNGEWIAAKILQGIFGAPIESIAEVTIAHVFFTHELGKYMALYALALGYSNGIAPLIKGFINDGMGYQWVFYWCAIFCTISMMEKDNMKQSNPSRTGPAKVDDEHSISTMPQVNSPRQFKFVGAYSRKRRRKKAPPPAAPKEQQQLEAPVTPKSPPVADVSRPRPRPSLGLDNDNRHDKITAARTSPLESMGQPQVPTPSNCQMSLPHPPPHQQPPELDQEQAAMLLRQLSSQLPMRGPLGMEGTSLGVADADINPDGDNCNATMNMGAAAGDPRLSTGPIPTAA